MKNILLIIGLCLLPFGLYAGGNHYTPPVNVDNGGGGRSHGKDVYVLVLATLIGCGIYAAGWDKVCFTGEPINLAKTTGSSVPENPANEYITIRQKR